MSDLFPVAGAKFYIGGAMATSPTPFDAADFSGESWVEVDGWETCGDYGDNSEIISTNLINRDRTVKQKGTSDAGTMENRFTVITGDAGMAAVLAAQATKNNYAFRIVWDDEPSTGVSPAPTTQYFVGLVASVGFVGGGANTIRMRNVVIPINSNIVTVEATDDDS